LPGFSINSAGNRIEPSNNTEIFRSHRWRIIALGGESGGAGLADKLIYVKSLQLPSFTFEEETVIGGAIKYKFAKTVNWEDVVVTFYDTVGVYDNLINWQNDVYTPSAGIKPADSYKRQSSFALTDGSGAESHQFVLKNSWPKSVSHSALSYDNSEIKLLNLTLSYDWAEIFFSTRSQ